jgi:hypothetical protein
MPVIVTGFLFMLCELMAMAMAVRSRIALTAHLPLASAMIVTLDACACWVCACSS